ncbi:MAG: class I SAM-dependent rRNA methyltransferase [Gammaproteobacteria bacterium]
MSDSTLAPLRVKKNEERRLRAGHPWVYSNEVDTERTPLSGFEPGQPVEVRDFRDAPLGTGYINPHALICARLVSRDPAHPFSASLLVHRLNIALALREMRYDKPFYRLVYGDSDGLPGLVVDRYDTVLVVQMATAGMERMKEDVLAALDKVIKPSAILLRNDSAARAMEGLESYVTVAAGLVPDVVALEENGVRFQAPLLTGQKTGWFYDQRENRARLAPYVRGKRVLDMFSYLGGFGIQAAAFGADSVLCVDSSAPALEGVHANVALNAFSATVDTLHGDAFDALKQLREQREHFDVVVVDPPAFIKRKKDMKEGVQAYRRINQMAMQVLAKDGILLSCSCSFHMTRESLLEQMLGAARHIDRSLQILEQGHQATDHPVHPAISETDYLKCFVGRVLPA